MNDYIRTPRFSVPRGSWGIRKLRKRHSILGIIFSGPEEGTNQFFRVTLLCSVFTEPRRCPGIHLIQSSFWLVIARVVATLDVKERVVNGVPIKVEVMEKNAFFR